MRPSYGVKFWRKMEKSVGEKQEELLLTVTEEKIIPRTVRRRKANWTGHILLKISS